MLPHLHNQHGSVHPGAFLGRGHALGLGRGEDGPVFFDQRQDAHGCVIVKDQFALGRLFFHLLKDPIGTVTYRLDLVPLRRIRDWDPQHGLVSLQAIPWHAQVIAAHRQHRSGLGRVFLCPHARRQPRRKDLATRRATQLFYHVVHGTEQGVAVNAYLHPGGQGI